jgi:phage terminase large subunit
LNVFTIPRSQTIKADERIERYAIQARDAGLPRDQAERFINAGYVAFPKNLRFHAAARECDRQNGPDEVSMGGTRYTGKSHAAMAQVGLDDCQRVPGLKVLFLRKVLKSASESFEDIVYKVFRYIPFEYKEGRVDFSNGSRILIGGFHNDSDIEKYLGIEYDVLVGEEFTQLSEKKQQQIYGSIRSSVPGWRARKYLTWNPEGVGYAPIKKRFVIPWRNNAEQWTRFFFCHWQDNPIANPEYVRFLNSLIGPLAKAWKDGNLDSYEGMALPELDLTLGRHLITPYELPYSWPRWRAIDYGFIHLFVCGWFAKDPATGRIIIYRVIAHQMLSDKMQARTILEQTPPTEHIDITFAPPDMWARKADEKTNRVTSPADNYAAEGLILTKADNDRINGARKLHSALADLADGKPGLQVFSTCMPLAECLQAMVTDPNNQEDMLKVDCDPATGLGGDDYYDMTRYGLTNVKLPQPPPSTEVQLSSNILEASIF